MLRDWHVVTLHNICAGLDNNYKEQVSSSVMKLL